MISFNLYFLNNLLVTYNAPCFMFLVVVVVLFVGHAAATAADQTYWTTCGRALLLNGKRFFIKGVNYSPVPIGQSSGQDFLTQSHIWKRDFALLRKMNANAIKVYDYNIYGDHTESLNAAYNDGIQPIYIVFTLWIPPYVMMPHIGFHSDTFNHYVHRYRQMAEQVGSHRATMGFSIGGEINMHPHVMNEPFWTKFNRLCQAVREGLAVHGAQKIVTTTFIDDGSTSFETGDKFNAGVDLWGASVYQKYFVRDMLPLYRQKTQRPLVFAEYGLSYSSANRDATEQEVGDISTEVASYARALQDDFSQPEGQIIVGGFLFEYSDEWWKAGAFETHDRAGFANPNFPFGHMAEEYFGLYQVSRSSSTPTNRLTPRPIVSKLTNLWSNPVGGEYVDACGHQVPSVAPVPTTESSSEDKTDITAIGECNAGAGNINIGIDMFYDPACRNGGLGCDSVQVGCRYCIAFGTGPYTPCPSSQTQKPTETPMPTEPPTTAPTHPPPPPPTTAPPTEPPTQAPTHPPPPTTAPPTEPPTEAPTKPPPPPTEPPTEAPTKPPPPPTEPPTEAPTVAASSDSQSSTINCSTTAGNIAIGIGMVFDQSCIDRRGGLGCDMARLGCRFCMTPDSGRDGPYFPCDDFHTPEPSESESEEPTPAAAEDHEENAAAPTPKAEPSQQSHTPRPESSASNDKATETPEVVQQSSASVEEAPTPSSVPKTDPPASETDAPPPGDESEAAQMPSESASQCLLTQKDIDSGIGVVEDPRCETIGGFGCDSFHPGCRYCEASIGAPSESSNLLPCGSLHFANCSATEDEMNVGISSYFDASCLIHLDFDCQTTHAGCRYCHYTSSPSKYRKCPDHDSEKISEHLNVQDIESSSSFSVALVASIGGVVGVLGLVIVVAIISRYKRHRNRTTEQPPVEELNDVENPQPTLSNTFSGPVDEVNL